MLGLATAGGELTEDMAEVSPDAEYLAIRGKARGLDRLKQLSNLTVLWASGITPQLVDALPAASKLRAINLYQVGRTELAAVGRLSSLEHLLIGWANHLVDLSWLAQLPRLRTLVIEDAFRLDLDTLPRLPSLQAFQLGGGIWKVLKLPSLAPIRRLPGLRFLSLNALTVADGSLSPLGDLPELQSLHTANIFSVEESARLAARHPDIDSPTLRPIFMPPTKDAQGDPVFPCGMCGAPKLMPTRRRAPLWCPHCDAMHIRKHVAKWEAARASASGRVP